MPCWTVSRTTIAIPEVLKNRSLLGDAVRSLNGVVIDNDPGYFRARIDGVVVTISNGKATWNTSDEDATALMNKLVQACGIAAAKKSAQDEGWTFIKTGPGTFDVIKNAGF